MLVQKKIFRLPELLLQCGRTLREVEVGYETYGTLNEAGDNAVLIAHYFSGNSHAAGRYQESDPEPGYWDAIIGPGKAIDTNKYFVVSSDTLANVNAKVPTVVSTGPSSIDPATGRYYGSDFPIVTIGDFVTVQKALSDALGIRHFQAVCGPSMGALQSFEWAVRYPDMISKVISVIGPGIATEPYLISLVQMWAAPILLDPDFNGGDYYGQREPLRGLQESFKNITLTCVGYDWANRLYQRRLGDRSPDPAIDLNGKFAIDQSLDDLAKTRASMSDANALLRTARAVQLFSIHERKNRLKAKFLFVSANSDLVMQKAYTDRGIKEIRELGLSVSEFIIEGDGGHLDGLNKIAQAADSIRSFLES
jgi:homoserine O-acetyltransferase/O-succinyltransferase